MTLILKKLVVGSIDRVAEELAKEVEECLNDPKKLMLFRDTALRIVKVCPPHDYLCECKAIQKWIQKNFRYVKDPTGIELFDSPYVLLKRYYVDKALAQADCETLSQLYCCLVRSIGHKCHLVLVDTTGDGEYNHCMAIVKPRGSYRWYWVELTRKVPFGWKPPIYKYKIIKIKVE